MAESVIAAATTVPIIVVILASIILIIFVVFYLLRRKKNIPCMKARESLPPANYGMQVENNTTTNSPHTEEDLQNSFTRGEINRLSPEYETMNVPPLPLHDSACSTTQVEDSDENIATPPDNSETGTAGYIGTEVNSDKN